MSEFYTGDGTPYAPDDPEAVDEMMETIGIDSYDELFTDIPDDVRFEGTYGLDSHSERETMEEATSVLDENDDLIEFMGRGSYNHYVPEAVDHLANRQEFLTSYTQYQQEVSQGFLQALFEYQSMMSELTGLGISQASVYDEATAIGEAATLSVRVRDSSGDTVLIPEQLRDDHKGVLDNYADGADLTVKEYSCSDGSADLDDIEATIDEDVVMVYAENPTIRGVIEEDLDAIGDLADEHDAVFTVGSDPVALSVLEPPADAGADVVVGQASVLGTPLTYGFSVGLFSAKEDYLRQLPGRIAGATEEQETDKRVYALVLATREQHIRRERATSNICTSQNLIAVRTAIHTALLGPSGLVNLAETCIDEPDDLAAQLDDIDGVTAPVDDGHHFREFAVETEDPAADVAEGLKEEGFAVHVIDDNELQICVTDVNAPHTDDLVAAFKEVVA